MVDAAQGVEAQTVANTYAAVEAGLELIPVLNKVDLPSAEPERVATEIVDLLGGDPADVLRISAKTGEGVEDVLEAIAERIPPPQGDPEAAPRALIFDSEYDPYRGRGRLRPPDRRRPSVRASGSSPCRRGPRRTSTRSASSRPRCVPPVG